MALVRVATLLVGGLTKDNVTRQELRAAIEAVEGMSFSHSSESTTCKIMAGIHLDEFDALIDTIAKRLGVSDKVRQSVLEGKFAKVNDEVIREFSCPAGEAGRFTYGRVVTLKTDRDTINLAYSVYHLDFKLSPQVIERKSAKKFLGFTYSSKVWYEEKEDYSAKELDQIRLYFKHKAIEGFKAQYGSILGIE